MRMARNDMGEWVRWLAGYAPVCQVCNAQRAIEAHHLYFGAMAQIRTTRAS